MPHVHRHQVDLESEVDRSLNMLRSATAKSRRISVGIVGAGFAGLRCADVLLRHGCDVTMFEARNRLGGRVAQSSHLGHRVDLGPNWIHGTSNNPIMQLAKQTDTRIHDWAEKGAAFDVDGNELPPEDEFEYTELLWGDDGLIPAAFRYSDKNTDTIDPQTSLYDFFLEQSKSFFVNESADVAERKRRQFLHTCFMYSFYIGSPMTKQSLRYFWLEECIGGENPFVAETYHKIADAVSHAARERANIRLDTEIVGYSSDVVTGTASVQAIDGSSYSFDELVITVPLGCLKQTKSAFKPELPRRLSQAIDNIGYGHLDKVYITFPSAFWNVPCQKPLPEMGHHGLKETSFKNALPAVTPSSDDRHEHYASFVHFLQPNYAKSTNPNGWMQEAVNLAALRADCAHPTLLFYIMGPNSKYIADLVAQARSDQERDNSLIEFFKPYFSRLPNYTEADAMCVPTAVLATAWANDKFAGYGSYSNFPVGVEEADKDIEVMRHGMPERRIWLAGEHTAPFIALGTSTGAYWSGEGVAKRIAKAYGIGDQ